MKRLKNLFRKYVAATHSLALIVVFSCFSSSAQVEDVKRVVQELCSPEFHGRGYVNGGDSIAARYIAREFQKAGLQNLTPNYYQHFSFPVNAFEGKAEFSKSYDWWDLEEDNGDWVLKTDTTKFIVGQDVIVHPMSPSYHGLLIYKTVDISLIFKQDEIIKEIEQITTERNYHALAFDVSNVHPDTLKIFNSFKLELAQFIPVVVITDKKFTWSVSREQLKNPIFEIQSDIAEIIGSLDVQLDATLKKEHTTQNVIGFLPAKKKTKKTIVFTAHYDHLGRLGQDTYFPGANDNASGTAMLIALAHYFKQNPIDYNILFIAFAGEEIGLLGSKHYVENPVQPLKDISFLLNLDIFGSGEDGITVVNGAIFLEHFDLLTDINEEKQLLTQIKSRGYAANSDHYWFTEKGVPAFFIYTMGPNRNYHDIFDTYENLSFAEVNDLTVLLATFIERLATVKVKKKK